MRLKLFCIKLNLVFYSIYGWEDSMKHLKSKNTLKIGVITAALLLSTPVISGFLGSSNDTKNTPNSTPKPVAQNPSVGMQMVSYADAVALASPAVVSINTTKEIPIEMNPLFQDPMLRFLFENNPNAEIFMNPKQSMRKQNGLGSGVIVNDKGYILTNYHVIQDADSIVVTLSDGKTVDAKMIGVDSDTDLAVLQIKMDKYPTLPVGTSKKLRVGDVVLAIGNPFGFDRTVTQGILSATERSGAEIGILANLLQTDAAINPGNSGGALIDAYGNLIGINTAIVSKTGGYQGIGFAIPIEQAMDIMEKLITKGHISRGYLGVTLQNITKELSEQMNFKGEHGVFIRAIVPNSPAHQAGLLPGDIITKVNNTPVKDNKTATQIISGLLPGPGKNYTLDIVRKGEPMIFAIALGERKSATFIPPNPEREKEMEKQKEMERIKEKEKAINGIDKKS